MIVIMHCGYGVITFCSRMIPHAFYINAWSYAGRKVNWLILHGSHSASLTIPELSSPSSLTSRHHFVFSRTRYLALPLQYDGCRYSRSQIVPRNTKRHHLARRLRGCIQVPFASYIHLLARFCFRLFHLFLSLSLFWHEYFICTADLRGDRPHPVPRIDFASLWNLRQRRIARFSSAFIFKIQLWAKLKFMRLFAFK